MDPMWILFLGFFLTLSVPVTSTANRTLSARSSDSRSPRRPGESRSNGWERARTEAPTDEETSRKPKAKCVDIPQTMSLCRGIGYLKMRLPNLLDHETIAKVQREAAAWTPLLSTRCSANTRLFLCSLFSPVCLDRPIWPCRSLCLEVKRGCEAQLASRGHPWPEILNCEKLPSDDDLCIGIQSNRSNVQDAGVVRDKGTAAQARSQSGCKICQNISSGLDSIMNSFCESDFVARIKPEISVITGAELKLMPKRKAKFFKRPAGVALHKRRQTFFVTNGAKCDCFEPSYAAQYLITGHVIGKYRMVITSAVKFDAKSKALRKAVKVIKEKDNCPASDSKDKAVSKKNYKNGKLNDRKASKPNRKKKERKNNSDRDFRRAGNKANRNGKREHRKKEPNNGKNIS